MKLFFEYSQRDTCRHFTSLSGLVWIETGFTGLQRLSPIDFTSLSGLVWIETKNSAKIASLTTDISPAFRGWYRLKQSKIEVLMSPSMNHSRLQVALGAAFLGLNDYAVYSELSIEISGKEYVPDIAIYPIQPINLLNDKIKVSEPPLLIVEILSPTQNIQELVDKFKIYFDFGIKSCWLVLPVSHAITVFNNLHETPATYSHDNVIDKALGISLGLSKIFLD